MKRSTLSLGIMGAIAAAAMAIAPTAADAQYYRGGAAGWHDRGFRGGYGGPPAYRGGRGDYDRGYYGRHDRCHGGSGGAIIGAIAGGLLGNAAAGYGDRAAGTIIGGGVGALAGSAIGRDC